MQKKYFLGLDIGGSKISGIVFGGKKALNIQTVATPKNLERFKSVISQLCVVLSSNQKISSIGIGIPGMADKKGRIIYAPNLRFSIGFNLKKFLMTLGFDQVVMENDANCFALAEKKLGQGKNLQNFIGITLGTGIGGGLILGRQLYRGIHGSAGEVGHMMADIRQTYEQRFQKLRREGEWENVGMLLGRLIADVLNTLDLEAVILGGSISEKFGKKILLTASAEAKKHLLNKQIVPKVLISRLKNAGALGAALLSVSRI